MRKAPILLILLAAAILAACSSRQPAPKMDIPTAERRLYTLKHRLNLTDVQTQAVKPIIEKEYEQKKELLASFKPGDRQAMKEIRQKKDDLEWDTTKKLSAHLTKEQMELYSTLLAEEEQQMKEKMQSQRGSKGPGGGRGRRPM